jgi:hypothetical protein
MAERRMFTKKITDDENFMSLSSSAQALYLHLSMSADDDGFSNQVSISMFKAHASVQDLEALLEKRYIYQFENGVIVIKHWRMANALRKDRYSKTTFRDELEKLKIKKNGSYSLTEGIPVTDWLPDGCQKVAEELPDGCQIDAERLPQNRVDKNSKEESSKEESREDDSDLASARPALAQKESKHKYGEYHHVLLTEDEYNKLSAEYGNEMCEDAIKFLDEYIEMKGYKAKSHYLAIRKWVINAVNERKPKQKPQETKSSFDNERKIDYMKLFGQGD